MPVPSRMTVHVGRERGRATTVLAGLLICGALLAGCGSSGGRPELLGATPHRLPPPEQPPQEAYRLKLGDELRIYVVGAEEFNATVEVRPDGRISAPGVGDVLVLGRTLDEVTEELRAQLRRLVRYPDVTVVLSEHAQDLVYVFGEVVAPGERPYVPHMTTLHAVASAAGPERSARLDDVLVLRRTGPQEMDVYRVDLAAARDGDVRAQDLALQPYDVVFVPKTAIAKINDFMDQYVRQNVVPFTAYIEGWRAFHVEEIYWRNTNVQ